MYQPFSDRYVAGRILAKHLREYANRPDVLVLGLPRGGVPVAFEVAQALGAPLDVFLVRKLGAPGQEELAMGAIASGGIVVINQEVLDELRIPCEQVEEEITRERSELTRREVLYRGDRRPVEVAGKTVIVVDDGLATGSTMRAVVRALRKREPAKIVVAVPTAAPAIRRQFSQLADQCVCSIEPQPFRAVGLWYTNFDQIQDEEVCALMARSEATSGSPAPAGARES